MTHIISIPLEKTGEAWKSIFRHGIFYTSLLTFAANDEQLLIRLEQELRMTLECITSNNDVEEPFEDHYNFQRHNLRDHVMIVLQKVRGLWSAQFRAGDWYKSEIVRDMTDDQVIAWMKSEMTTVFATVPSWK